MKYNLIVAMCQNNGIGYKGVIPWHLKADLKYFSKLTKGKGKNALVMGNNTWQSLPSINSMVKGLPGRDNFILSKSGSNFDMLHNCERLIKTFKTIDELEVFFSRNGNGNGKAMYEEIWIIGGAQIYNQFLLRESINKCYITYIDKEFNCDTFFPVLEPSDWLEVERKSEYDTGYVCKVDYVVYEKVRLG